MSSLNFFDNEKKSIFKRYYITGELETKVPQKNGQMHGTGYKILLKVVNFY